MMLRHGVQLVLITGCEAFRSANRQCDLGHNRKPPASSTAAQFTEPIREVQDDDKVANLLCCRHPASAALDFGKQDSIAATFCGSQKSLVSGVPMASALFSAAAIGPVLIPIMIYYPMQLVVCAWLGRRYAVTLDATLAVRPGPEMPPMRKDRAQASTLKYFCPPITPHRDG